MLHDQLYDHQLVAGSNRKYMREGSAASLVSGHYKHLGVTKQARIVDDKVAKTTLTTVSFKAQYRAARSVRSFKVR